MTILLSLLGKYWPYIAILVGGSILGAYAMHKADSVPLSALQAKYSQYVAQVATENAAAQKAAADVIAAQLKQHQTIEANNDAIITKLQADKASAESDRNIALRLLHSAATANSPGSGGVPEAADQSTALGASPADGGTTLTSDLAAAIGECRSNADQLDALIAELKPQI